MQKETDTKTKAGGCLGRWIQGIYGSIKYQAGVGRMKIALHIQIYQNPYQQSFSKGEQGRQGMSSHRGNSKSCEVTAGSRTPELGSLDKGRSQKREARSRRIIVRIHQIRSVTSAGETIYKGSVLPIPCLFHGGLPWRQRSNHFQTGPLLNPEVQSLNAKSLHKISLISPVHSFCVKVLACSGVSAVAISRALWLKISDFH